MQLPICQGIVAVLRCCQHISQIRSRSKSCTSTSTSNRYEIRIVAIKRRHSQRLSHLILFSFFDLASLIPQSLLFTDPILSLVSARIPIQVFSLLPSTDGSHDRVTEIVFSVRRRCDIGPAEFCAAAAGSLLADCLEEIHLGQICGLWTGSRSVDVESEVVTCLNYHTGTLVVVHHESTSISCKVYAVHLRWATG